MRVLTWNLYHGRDVPPGKHPLLAEFAELLDGLDWDVALLQEAPPRWFRELQQRTRSSGARILTSRNSFSWLRGRLADWRPDLMRSGEGGSNQLLVREPDGIADHRAVTLTWLPERRKMHWVRLDSGACVANLHASTNGTRAGREVVRAAALAAEWSDSMPLVFGGDLNLRPARQPQPARPPAAGGGAARAPRRGRADGAGRDRSPLRARPPARRAAAQAGAR